MKAIINRCDFRDVIGHAVSFNTATGNDSSLDVQDSRFTGVQGDAVHINEKPPVFEFSPAKLDELVEALTPHKSKIMAEDERAFLNAIEVLRDGTQEAMSPALATIVSVTNKIGDALFMAYVAAFFHVDMWPTL